MTEQERQKAERLMQRKEALNVSYREIASVYAGQTGKGRVSETVLCRILKGRPFIGNRIAALDRIEKALNVLERIQKRKEQE